MINDDKSRSAGRLNTQRNLWAATAILATFIGTAGLAGIGLSGPAGAEFKPKPPPQGPISGIPVPSPHPVASAGDLNLLLTDAMRTGDPRRTLQRHQRVKLTQVQQRAFLSLTRAELRALRSAQVKLRPLKAGRGGQMCIL